MLKRSDDRYVKGAAESSRGMLNEVIGVAGRLPESAIATVFRHSAAVKRQMRAGDVAWSAPLQVSASWGISLPPWGVGGMGVALVPPLPAVPIAAPDIPLAGAFPLPLVPAPPMGEEGAPPAGEFAPVVLPGAAEGSLGFCALLAGRC